MRSHRFHATRVLVFLLAVASLVAATRPTPALADALSDLYGCQYDREEVYVGDGESGDATAAIVSEGSSDGDGSARSVQTVAPREISGEMLYFCTWESGQNYDQGLSWGDGYAAMGYFQFDRGSDLGAFLHAVYNYDPTTYSCLRVIGDRYGWNLSEKAAGPTRSNGAFTQLGNDLNAAWHACYKANPTEFSQLQNGWAYDNYYVPAANYMRSRGIPIDNRSDSVKSLCWGMSNLFGTGGWRKFVGGRTNGYDWNGNWNSSKDWPGAGLAADMSDEEFVATLCDYVVDNVSVFYKAQPQYWDGWRNRYRSEKAHYLQVIAENEASSRQALDELADANRSTLADGEYVVRARCAGRLVLDVYGGYSSAGTNVQLWEPNSTDGQVWEVSHDEAGYVTLTCAGSGKVLDVWGGSPRAGANAQQWDPTGGWNQKWVAVPGQDGGVTLVSAMRSDLALDVYGGYSAAGTNVQLWTATGGASQSFEFEPAKTSRQTLDELADANRSTLADGEYVVRARCAGRLVLDVYGGYSSAGTNVQLWEPNSTDGQVWEVSHDEAGYVTLTCAGSGKVLDVWGGSPRAGANAQQWDPTGGWNQKWVAVPGQDGGVTLVSAMRSDLALDVYGGYSAAGTNVQLWTATGGASQSFEFIAAHPDIAPGSRLVSLEGVWSDIVPVCADGLALDVYGGYSAVGTNVQTWTPSGTLGQAFRLEWRDGYYAIVNAASGLAIGSAGQGVVPGANACLCDPGTAGDGALFAATDNGDGTVTFVNKATGLALDIYGGYSAAGTNVQLWTATGGASQRFSVEPRSHVLGEGAYTIASPSGLLIDLSHGSDEDGAQAVLFSPNEGLNQRWYLTPVDGRDGVYTVESLASAKRLAAGADGSVSQRAASDDASQWWRVDVETGYVRLESVSSPGTRLAAGGGSGARVGLSSANDPSTQRFSLAPAEAALPTGTYVVRPASDPSLALDVYGASLANGANVQAWGFSDGGNQKWRLSPAAGGAFAVTNCLSGKALDVQGGSATPGANVEQFSPNGGANQRWRVTYRPGGWVLVSELDSSLVLTLSGGAASGSNAVVDRDSGAADQRFTFRRTTYVPSDRQEMVWKAQGYYSSTNWLILVDNTDNKVGIFNGSRGNWNLVQYWTCTTGKASTPTVLGEYQVGSRGYSFGSGFTCYYWTQFYHDYLFHSIPYDENTFRVQDGRLGQNLSHGCVRLDINNAKWIYDNIPTRTKVVSYR